MRILNFMLAIVGGAVAACLLIYWVAGRGLRERAGESERPGEARVVATAPVVVESAKGVEAGELARLAKENAGLKEEIEAMRGRLAGGEETLKRTQEQLDELRRPMEADILSSTLRADLKSGEVVVTGGYKLADGRRLYAFATPVVEEIDGAKQVRISARYLTLTDAAGSAAGLDNLSTNAANTLQHGEVWVADEERAVLEKVGTMTGVDVVTAPKVSLRSGGSGLISIGDVQLKVTPTLAGEGDGLGMELRLEQPQVPGTPGAPITVEGAPEATPGSAMGGATKNTKGANGATEEPAGEVAP